MTPDFKRFTGKVVWVDKTKKTKNIRATVPPVYQANTPEDIQFLPLLAPKCFFNKSVQIGDTVNVYIQVNPDVDYNSRVFEVYFEQDNLDTEVGFYEPYAEYSDNAQKFLVDNAENDPEVMMLHENAGQIDAQLYDAAHGFITKTGNTMMQVSPNGNWGIQSESTKVAAEGNSVVIGDNSEESTQHPAVLGDNLKDLFKKIADSFSEASLACTVAHRPDIGKILDQCSTNIMMALQDLTTDQVKISKGI